MTCELDEYEESLLHSNIFLEQYEDKGVHLDLRNLQN